MKRVLLVFAFFQMALSSFANAFEIEEFKGAQIQLGDYVELNQKSYRRKLPTSNPNEVKYNVGFSSKEILASDQDLYSPSCWITYGRIFRATEKSQPLSEKAVSEQIKKSPKMTIDKSKKWTVVDSQIIEEQRAQLTLKDDEGKSIVMTCQNSKGDPQSHPELLAEGVFKVFDAKKIQVTRNGRAVEFHSGMTSSTTTQSGKPNAGKTKNSR